MTSVEHLGVAASRVRGPWAWIPTLYVAEGLPYVVVMTLSVVMYKNLGISNTDIALYTSWLYLPWVIKPLWSRWSTSCGPSAAGSWRCSSSSGPGWRQSRSRSRQRLLPDDARGVLADGLQLGDARHRRRRLLHARAPRTRAGALRRRAQHVLPRVDDRRTGRAGASGRQLERTAGTSCSPGRRRSRCWPALFVVLFALSPRRAAASGATDTSAASGIGRAMSREVRRRRSRRSSRTDGHRRRSSASSCCSALAKRRSLKLVHAVPARLAGRRAASVSRPIAGRLRLRHGRRRRAAPSAVLLGGYVHLTTWLRAVALADGCSRSTCPTRVRLPLPTHCPTVRPDRRAAMAVEQFGYGFGFAAYMLYMIMVAARATRPPTTRSAPGSWHSA